VTTGFDNRLGEARHASRRFAASGAISRRWAPSNSAQPIALLRRAFGSPVQVVDPGAVTDRSCRAMPGTRDSARFTTFVARPEALTL